MILTPVPAVLGTPQEYHGYGSCPRQRVPADALGTVRYKRAPGGSGGGHVRLTSRWRNPRTGALISEAYQRRLLKNGIAKREYETGRAAKSGKLGAARGHAATPEHGLKDAAKNPDKYQDYLRKRPTGGQLPPVDIDQLRQDAYDNFHDIMGNHHAYNDQSVILRIMGDPADQENYPGMSIRELQLTKSVRTMREIQDLATSQRTGNPFWYH
jgi:hypothetical protein